MESKPCSQKCGSIKKLGEKRNLDWTQKTLKLQNLTYVEGFYDPTSCDTLSSILPVTWCVHKS